MRKCTDNEAMKVIAKAKEMLANMSVEKRKELDDEADRIMNAVDKEEWQKKFNAI